MPRLWRVLFAVVGIFALTLQYALAVQGQSEVGVAERTLNFFSYFTILTNVLVTLAFIGPAVGGRGRLGRWSSSEGVRAAVTLYAVVVGVSYHFLLAHVWDPQGWLFIANGLLHYVMPAAILIDWLAFTPKGRLRGVDAVKWLAFPLIYGVWTVIHGAATGWWPYWFIDIATLGLTRAALNFAALLIFFLIVGLALVGVDRLIGRRAAPISDSAA